MLPLRSLTFLTAIAFSQLAFAQESLWIEAEHFDGISGYCWPMGKPEMKKTNGHWGISGPGWAAEWNQGGESGFMSIATGGADTKAVATKTVQIPTDGHYHLWVRYGDWREKPEPFQIQIEQNGKVVAEKTFGEKPMVDEDSEIKLYYGWLFVWDSLSADLKKGPAKLTLRATVAAPEPRQVDVVVLTTDANYRPRIKNRPHNPAWDVLESYRRDGIPSDLAPLARKAKFSEPPAVWHTPTFQNKGFLYLWNATAGAPYNWLSDKPDRVLYPYNIADKDVREEFEKKYGGKTDVPIFSDPRVVPAFHTVGGGVFSTDAKTGEVNENGKLFAKWLDAHPERFWGTMMNYHPGVPVGAKGLEQFQKYRDRYVGSIAGENLGYFEQHYKGMDEATSKAKTRRELAAAMTSVMLPANREKYRVIYGKDIDANPYKDVISCLSVGNICFMPICFDWGARSIGYESFSACSSVLGMRWAFMRGAARQHGGLTTTYRSCNFGDGCTMFADVQTFSKVANILDNFYSVYSGAGLTWYKMDIWYQYMAGSSMFYHEQGHDEFWKPGGTTAAGIREVQLSPKGQLVDRFLRLTAKEPDRGTPYTPVAFLVDYAHGWEPAPYWPNSFKNFHGQTNKFHYDLHEKMLEEYFWTAYYPEGREAEKPTTATNEVYVPGVFGDIFDVIYAYPDVSKWKTIDTYPVVVVAGEIELTAAEGQRLHDYVEKGGTLLVADAHLTGPGVAALKLPTSGEAVELNKYKWFADGKEYSSPTFRARTLPVSGTDKVLASTIDGKPICAAYDRGQGRLIYLTVPHGLAISRQAVPILPQLYAHLTRGLMPVEVRGDVNWLVNRTKTGWVVTLLNPAGQLKPQQGINAPDFRENRPVTIHLNVPAKSAHDRMLPTETMQVIDNKVRLEVPAGGVRIIELK